MLEQIFQMAQNHLVPSFTLVPLASAMWLIVTFLTGKLEWTSSWWFVLMQEQNLQTLWLLGEVSLLEHFIWLQSRLSHPPPPRSHALERNKAFTQMDPTYTSGSCPSMRPPPSLFLFSLSLIVLLFLSAGTKGSELLDHEDGRHADQCQQPQTWHYICLPHPAFLHASPRLLSVLLPSVLCLLFYFFLLHLLLIFLSVLLFLVLLSTSHRLRSVQRSPGAADARRMWVLVSHLQPPKIETGVHTHWRPVLWITLLKWEKDASFWASVIIPHLTVETVEIDHEWHQNWIWF